MSRLSDWLAELAEASERPHPQWGARWDDKDPWTRWLLWWPVAGCSINILVEPRDAWVGVYVKPYREMGRRRATVYVCPVPFVPLMIDVPLGR